LPPPVAVQFTPAGSVVVAVTVRFCDTVNPARFGVTVTVKAPAAIVSVRFTVLETGVGVLESVTLNVSALAVTVAVGRPLIAPVVASSVKPSSEPIVNAHVKGGVPPVAASVAL
jgi:hypothetical protein